MSDAVQFGASHFSKKWHVHNCGISPIIIATEQYTINTTWFDLFDPHCVFPGHLNMAVDAPNPLLTTSKPSDALSIKLHPLVLLTISDFITRHSLRGQHGPIVGAVIGQQNGREITMEHAFECNVKAGETVNGEETVILDENFFATRLEQCTSR